MRRDLIALLAAAIALVGCADEPSQPQICPPRELPSGFERACTADGECAGYLVCGDQQSCGFPAAMVGGEAAATVWVEATGEAIPVEVAAGELARSRGLAGRSCMQPGWGLLLAWPEPTEVAITMAEMRFDLDLVFVDEEGVVVDVRRGRAGETALYRVGAPVRWVLEVEAGLAEELGVEVGGVVTATQLR